MKIREITTSKRVFVTGANGSGKTYFCKHILLQAPRLVVVDPKGLIIHDKEWRLSNDTNGVIEALKNDPTAGLPTNEKNREPLRVWVPDPGTDEKWEDLLSNLFTLRNVIIYIDELYGVGPAKRSPGLRALYTRGREYGIGVWGVSQRPRDIPVYAISEADYMVIFRLSLLRDREYVAEVAQNREVEAPLRDHQFYFTGPGFAVKYREGLNANPPKIGVAKNEYDISRSEA